MIGSQCCSICGTWYSDTTTCPHCMWLFNKDLDKNILPPGVTKRFFGLVDWQSLRRIEKELAEGKLTEEEARAKSKAKIEEIKQAQARARENEQRLNEKDEKIRSGYLY